MRVFFRWLLAVFFIVAGAYHFIRPAMYLPMMPPWVPWPREMIALSGVAEILGGVAILIPKTRVAGGWWLIAVLVAVFPANVQMALDGLPTLHVAPWVLWARLPLQGVLIWWVYLVAMRKSE